MPKKVTDQNAVVAKQLAASLAYAVQSGKYVPVAFSDGTGSGLAFSSLDVMTHSVLSQLLTIAALGGSSTRPESTKDVLLELHVLRRTYPDLADMIDFAITRVKELEAKRQVAAHEQWVAASMEPSIKSGELFKRLNYRILR